MMAHVRIVSEFFNNSPEHFDLLSKKIKKSQVYDIVVSSMFAIQGGWHVLMVCMCLQRFLLLLLNLLRLSN